MRPELDITQMNTVEDMWKVVIDAIYAPHPDMMGNSFFMNECRRAFYGGATLMFNRLTRGNLTEADLRSLRQELLDYANDLQAAVQAKRAREAEGKAPSPWSN